ncbi:MAG: hypothetical protein NTW14_06890 [bacterium]|nr:hypothetical protein [bacterium]
MKLCNSVALIAAMLMTAGCSDKDSSTNSTNGRTFSGITERNEWGDTLSVDTTDWVITTLPGGDGPYFTPSHFPGLMVTLDAQLRSEPLPPNDSVFSIGVFPNPFIPRAGRMIMVLNLPQSVLLNIWLEDESGEVVIPLVGNTLPSGQHLLTWTGIDSAGNYLSDGIYRIFLTAGAISSFGDVRTIISNYPTPANNTPYVQYAYQNYSLDQYDQFEYYTATHFGADGMLAGGDIYLASFNSWQALNYNTKFQYLPFFMNYDLNLSGAYQDYYLLAYKHFQFGAGWPGVANIGVADSSNPAWQLQNTMHDTFVQLFEEAP